MKKILIAVLFAYSTWLIAPVVSYAADVAPVYDADNMADEEDEMPDAGPAPVAPATAAPMPGINHQAEANRTPLTFEQRLRRAEQQISNLQSNDASMRLDALQNQVQSLRNQLEQLSHQLQQAVDTQKSMYTDLDKRLSQLANSQTSAKAKDTPSQPAKPVAPVANSSKANTTPSAEKQPEVLEEQKLYQTAYNLIKGKKYAEAVNALQSMLKKYPSGQFAANANYWLGELYGLLGQTDQAYKAFNNVIKNFPNSSRTADAELKIGIILAAQNKLNDAKLAFKKVMARYPGTATARLAAEQLKQIK